MVGMFPTQQIDVDRIREHMKAIDELVEQRGVTTALQMQEMSHALESAAQKLRIESRHLAIAEASANGLIDPA